jgi:hypothetical protein
MTTPMPTTTAATVCVIPGCTEPVTTTGTVSPTCVTAFGSMLQPGTGAPLTAAEITRRDTAVHHANTANHRLTTTAATESAEAN